MTKSASKSKTIRASAIIAVLGVVELNFHFLQSLLGDYYGVTFIIFSGIMAYYRTVTREPIK